MSIPELLRDPAATAVVNHLWQSTVVVAAAWALAWSLRKNHARVRYWVWFAASVKFLVPFSVLMELGGWLRSLIPAAAARPAVANVMEQVTQPFAQVLVFGGPGSTGTVHQTSMWPMVLIAVWACGAVVVLARFVQGWKRVYAAKRNARPIEIGIPSGAKAPDAFGRLDVRAEARTLQDRFKRQSVRAEARTLHGSIDFLAADVPVLCSAALIEPGIFGIFRPVLLIPEGILERLSTDQLRAIVAHEMCHVRRRDNLTFALHMIVEAAFWFFPPVWWIGARLIEERERACDEAVLSSGGEAQVYAEGILNVCKFYVETPIACAAGVTGADLKKRIVRIMTEHVVRKLDFRKKLLLGTAAVIALAVPLLAGLVSVSGVRAEVKAEDEAANLPKFDVASIKPHKDEGGMMRMGFGVTPDGIRTDGVPLHMIVLQAFGVSNDRILNEPDWVKSNRYDMEAKVSPEDAPKLKGLTQRQRGVMLLPVLEDRFGLKFHHETRELNVYTLVVAKGGPKLKAAQPGQAGDDGPIAAKPGPGGAIPGPRTWMRMSPQGMTLESRGAPMETLAGALSRELGATVIDKTGLTDKYDYTLNFMPEYGARRGDFGPPPPPPPSPGGGAAQSGGPEAAPADTPPSLVDAVQEQLGLKLVKQKEPVDVIVIDHIEQPSPN